MQYNQGIVQSASRKTISSVDTIMTESHLKKYCLTILRFHVSRALNYYFEPEVWSAISTR